MRYIYLLLSKFGVHFSGIGRIRLDSAISAFTKAKKELESAIIACGEMTIKTGTRYEKMKAEFEKRENQLRFEIQAHEKIKQDSEKYLKKIESFLKVDE